MWWWAAGFGSRSVLLREALVTCLLAPWLPDFGMLPVLGASLLLLRGPSGTHLSSPHVTGGHGAAGGQRAHFLGVFIIEL